MLIDWALAEAIAQQALSEPYRQTMPVSTKRLERLLKDRGIGLRWETIHHLWAVGMLHPVAVLDSALALTPNLGTSSRFVDIDLGDGNRWLVDLGMEATEADLIPPVGNLPGELRDAVYWHPFQLWQFDQLARLLDVSIARDTVLRGADSVLGLAEVVLSWVRTDS